MSDSHKLSLLDLQVRDLSQYGKKNLARSTESLRSTDSSYRKQLSESLSKKQSSSPPESIQESESRSKSIRLDHDRSEKNQIPTDSNTDYREQQLQRDKGDQDENVKIPEENKVTNSTSESLETKPESKLEEKSDAIPEVTPELSEEGRNTESDARLSVNVQKPSFSLFDSSLAGTTEGQFEQVVFTDSGDIQPPANLQLLDDTNVENLPSEITETGPFDTLSVPDGLAEILKRQDVSISETEISQQTQEAVNSELNLGLETNEALPSPVASEGLGGEEELSLLSEELPSIQETKELQQAIRDFNKHQTDKSSESEGENQSRIQADLQQRYLRSKKTEQSGSDIEETNLGEFQLESGVVSQNSEVVTESIRQVTSPEQQSELVKNDNTKTNQAEQNTEEIASISANQIQNTVTETQNRIQADTAKISPLTQKNSSVIDTDQSANQPTGINQSISMTQTQVVAPSGTPIDVSQVEQLVERIASSVQQSQSSGQQLRIRLSPPELGTLQIEVSLKNGQYTAKLEVQNNQAQKVINDNIAQLRDALAKSGVAIDRIDVHINTDASEDQRSSQSDARSQFGSEYDSNHSSDSSDDTEQRQGERAFAEDSIQQDDSDQAQNEDPQVVRSHGVLTENVEEIDVQI